MTNEVLKPLELIKTENGFKITKYVKQLELVPIVEKRLTILQKLKKLLTFDDNPIYDELTTLQKSVLHTIAPIWANILEHKLEGSMIVTDDSGKRYNLNSMDSRSCLVGEAYGFGWTNCSDCHHFNMEFASLNHTWHRGSYAREQRLPEFLDHYYQNHILGNPDWNTKVTEGSS